MAICPHCKNEMLTATGCQHCEGALTSTELGQADASQESFKEIQTPHEATSNNTQSYPEQSMGSETKIKQRIDAKGGGNNTQVGHDLNVNILTDLASLLGIVNDQKKDTLKEKPYTEFTEELSFVDDSIPKLISNDIDLHCHDLMKDHIILISSYDPLVARAAMHALVSRIESECQSKKFLDFHKPGVNPHELTINLFLTTKSISEDSEIIAVSGIDDLAQTFVASLFADEFFGPQHIKNNLKKNNFFLICILDSSYHREKLEKPQKTPPFKLWEVPFLETRLQEFAPSQYEEMTAEILQQRKRGLWQHDASEFYREFTDYLHKGRIDKVIEERKKLKDERDLANLLQKNKSITASSLFEQDDPLKKVVLYVAAYFPELRPTDFHEIVSLLLGEKTTSVSTNVSHTTKKGKIKQIQQQEERRLIEIWQNDPDKILEQCYLQTSQFNDSVRVITFTSPYLRNDIVSYFEQKASIFLLHQFNSIMRLGLLFHPTDQVTNHVIDLAINMALAYPEQYGKEWLTRMIVSITYQLHMEVDPNASLEEMFDQILEKLEQKSFFYLRISKLLRKLLVNNQLKNTARSFLDQLFEWKQHKIVFDIVQYLRFVESFDTYFWMKRLIDGGGEVRLTVFQHLFQQANSFDRHSLLFLLRTIRSWLPEKEQDPAHSLSAFFALRFILDYSAHSIRHLEFDCYGKWPSQYPLFTDLVESSVIERFQFLFDWLFHRGMPAVLQKDESDLIYALLTEWYLILHGFAKEPKDKNVAERLQTFLEVLKAALKDAGKQRDLLNYWSNRLENLLAIVSSPSALPRLEIKRLNFEWILVRQLKKQFKNLSAAK